MAQDHSGDVFEGASHVLRGMEQQLAFWQGTEGHAAARQELLPVLTEATTALREALKRAKTLTR